MVDGNKKKDELQLIKPYMKVPIGGGQDTSAALAAGAYEAEYYFFQTLQSFDSDLEFTLQCDPRGKVTRVNIKRSDILFFRREDLTIFFNGPNLDFYLPAFPTAYRALLGAIKRAYKSHHTLNRVFWRNEDYLKNKKVFSELKRNMGDLSALDTFLRSGETKLTVLLKSTPQSQTKVIVSIERCLALSTSIRKKITEIIEWISELLK